jgi:hypothetical protein
MENSLQIAMSSMQQTSPGISPSFSLTALDINLSHRHLGYYALDIILEQEQQAVHEAEAQRKSIHGYPTYVLESNTEGQVSNLICRLLDALTDRGCNGERREPWLCAEKKNFVNSSRLKNFFAPCAWKCS